MVVRNNQPEMTRWAEGLTQDQLLAVIWMAGEYINRGIYVLICLGKGVQQPETGSAYDEARLKLTQLFRVPSDEPIAPNPQLPAISDSLRMRLTAKHTKWAFEIRDAALHVILANIGDFARVSDPLFAAIRANLHDGKCELSGPLFRATFALKALVEFVEGPPFDVDTYLRRMHVTKGRHGEWQASGLRTGDFDAC